MFIGGGAGCCGCGVGGCDGTCCGNGIGGGNGTDSFFAGFSLILSPSIVFLRLG